MKTEIWFDMDGTLVRVRSRFQTVYADLCEKYGIEPLDPDEYWRMRCNRISTMDILSATGGEEHYRAFIKTRTEMIEAPEYLALDTLRAGARETLGELALGRTLHLVSMRNNQENLLAQMSDLEIDRFFESVSCCSAFGTAADKAALIDFDGQGSGPGLIIGDTESDMEAGRLNGLTTIGLPGGMRTAELLAAGRPDHLIGGLAELPGLIDRLERMS